MTSCAADEPFRSAAPGTVHAGLADRTLRIETPEHVDLELPLAGLGSRFAALLLDLVVIAFALVAGPLLLVALLGFAGDLAQSLVVLWVFLVVWGYFFAFEAFRDGQTPGKRRLGLRAVMAGGLPLTLEAAAVRNLVRMVDIQGGGLLGGFVMLVTRRSQRLGDLAAGTVVVRELPAEFPPLPDETTTAVGAPRLDDKAFAAVELYLARRAALPPEATARLRATLLETVRDAARPAPGETDDAFLERLAAEEEARRRAAALTSRLGTAAGARLLASKRERWTSFQATVRRLRESGGLRRLDGEEVSRFAARYREVSADLARARTYGASLHTLWALERVVAAAHDLFHRPARRTARRVRRFLGSGFPRLVRRRWRPVVLAGLTLYVPAVATYAWVRAHPEAEPRLASAEMIMRAEEATERRAAGQGYIDIPLSAGTVVSTRLITNNVQVSFLAFAGGVLAGVFTAWLLAFNGLHLGSALALFANRDALDVIGTFVLPHGVLELTAIVIAGGAGLWMGSAWLLPGRRTRLAALAARGTEAVGLILGVAVLLVVAGLIEAFVSPSDLPAAGKAAFSALTAVLLAGYLGLGGRRDDGHEHEEEEDDGEAAA